MTIDGEKKDFYIRQLWDAKGSAEVELMDPSALEAYGSSAAGRSRERTRARATGSPSRPISAAATSSTARMATFAETYADQNERDYHALQEAAASGRVAAEMGA